ncbi:hypothetical protein EJ08DRAFT_687339 [Tothia fuscella]|uniref:Spt20-like SEP domain-containing protein n=1 Tax=Tothia fuscella TaxID=1048955 RepID=A0A9P4TZM8_9PEZI|nr:hypothetical protein EJ08DRAFT_687339 [Tothia fuscella]
MATAVAIPVRPQSFRQRRDPGLARVSTRHSTVEVNDYNMPDIPTPYVVTTDHILKKHDGFPPSLVVHLHPTHFRFDQQDGNFGYNSEMRFILEHIRNKTVPHQILAELFESGVKFYDGCLIVEVHNHRKGVNSSPSNTTNQVGGNSHTPYSVHNYNEHITPSPLVPFPDQKLKFASPSKSQTARDGEKSKDEMPAPEQPASAMQKKAINQAKITTVVLFPTPLSQYEEMAMLSNTQTSDILSKHQGATSRDGATPTMAHPPTPLTSIPPTPLSAKAPGRAPTMVLNEDNAHEFEAEIINRTAPPLYLAPAASLNESLAILDLLKHPQHSEKAPEPKSRKRTVAELAADEAQAAHLANLTGGPPGATTEGQGGLRGRFKTLENIRLRHLETERAKKEDDARKAQMKRQQQEADQAKKLEMEAKRQQEQQRRDQQQMYQQQQQQMQHAALQQQQAQNQAVAQQQANMAPVTSHPQQAVSAPQMSPTMQQHSSMSASPAPNGLPMTSVPNTSVPMATAVSNQGAGSPARPPSTISQQHSSAHNTPQMHSTPSMSSAIPARNMTPQPRLNQGSPIINNGNTPMMMTTPTPGMTPEQQQVLMMQQRNHALQQQAARLQPGQAMSPQQQQQQQMLQQAMLARQQQQQQQGLGTPTGQVNRMQQMNPQMGMMNGSPNGMPLANAQQINLQIQQQVQQLQQNFSARYAQEAKQRHAAYMQARTQRGLHGNLTQQESQEFHSREQHIKLEFQERLKEQKKLIFQRAHASQQQQAINMGMNMGMQQPGMMPQAMTMQQNMALQQHQQQQQLQMQQQGMAQNGMAQNGMMSQAGGMPQNRNNEQYMQQLHAQKQQMALQNMNMQQRMMAQAGGMAPQNMQNMTPQQQQYMLQQMRARQMAQQQQQQQQMNGMGMQQGQGGMM